MTSAPAAAPGEALAAPGAAPPAGDAPGAGAVLGVDVLSRTLKEADGAAHRLVAALREAGALDGGVVATHLTRLGPLPHVTLSVHAPALEPDALLALAAQALPGAALALSPAAPSSTAAPEPDAAAAAAGAAAHAAGTSGRAVHFPGVEALVGTLAVEEVLAGSAVSAVQLLDGSAAPPGTPLLTRDHVRPAIEQGRLVLAVERAAGGRLVPFEVPNPTPCCADH